MPRRGEEPVPDHRFDRDRPPMQPGGIDAGLERLDNQVARAREAADQPVKEESDDTLTINDIERGDQAS